MSNKEGIMSIKIINIYVYPFDSGINQYISIHKKIWQKLGLNVYSVKRLFSKKDKGFRKDRVVILNWFEDRLNSNHIPVIRFVECLLLLIFFKIRAKRIIWVKHNHVPHQLSNKKISKFLFFILKKVMKNMCCKVFTHTGNIGSEYIPHPLYTPKKRVLVQDRDIEFLTFGVVSKYKGITELLEEWPKNKKLFILGKSINPETTKQVLLLIKSRNLNIHWENKFIEQNEMNNFISRSKYIILPHHDDSMIVSGAFYHASGLGANIISKKNKFSDFLVERHGFITQYGTNLTSVLDELAYIDPEFVISDVNNAYGEEEVSKHWISTFLGIAKG